MRKLTTLLLSCILASCFTGVGFAGDDKDGDHDKQEFNEEVNVNVWVEDGKLTIDTGHGKKEIELSELHAGGEIPKALIEGIALGGEGGAKVRAKVLIIDDKGQRRVLNLGDGGAHDVDVIVHEGHHEDGDDEHHAEGHDGHHSHGKTARIIKKQLRLPGGSVQLLFEGDGKHFSIPELGEHFLWMQSGDDDGVHNIHANMFRGGDYLIGVELMPLSEMLRLHLGLEAGVGVGVRGVIEDTPAEEAGLEKHDIVVSANGEPLDGYEGLVEVVESAGESASTVTLGIIRAGERREVVVTPTKRQGGEIRQEVIIKRITEDEDGDDEDDEDDDESIDEIKEELKSLKKALKAIRKELGDRD